MKKIWIMAAAAFSLAACNNNDMNDDTTYGDTLITEPVAGMTPRSPLEGDVTYTEDRVRIYRNNAWVDADEDVRLDNGIIVYRDGSASRNGDVVVLEDGYVVDREGNVWDRTGNAVSDAWDATKHGVEKAGRAIGDAARKTGDRVEEAVD